MRATMNLSVTTADGLVQQLEHTTAPLSHRDRDRAVALVTQALLTADPADVQEALAARDRQARWRYRLGLQ